MPHTKYTSGSVPVGRGSGDISFPKPKFFIRKLRPILSLDRKET